MLFGGYVVRCDHLVILSNMIPLLIISGHYDVISKKIPKIINSTVFGFWVIFCNKYVLIVISIVNASKWWVTWPFSHYEFENDQFDHFIGKLIPISGLIISLSRNDYCWDQWILGFNLRYRTWHKLIIHRKSSKKL